MMMMMMVLKMMDTRRPSWPQLGVSQHKVRVFIVAVRLILNAIFNPMKKHVDLR